MDQYTCLCWLIIDTKRLAVKNYLVQEMTNLQIRDATLRQSNCRTVLIKTHSAVWFRYPKSEMRKRSFLSKLNYAFKRTPFPAKLFAGVWGLIAGYYIWNPLIVESQQKRLKLKDELEANKVVEGEMTLFYLC